MRRTALLLGCLAGVSCAASGPGAVKSVSKVTMQSVGTGVQVACASADVYVTFFSCKSARITTFSATGTDAKTALSAVDSVLLRGAPAVVPSANITVAKTSAGWNVSYQNGSPCVTVSVDANGSFAVAQGANIVAEAAPVSWSTGSSPLGTQMLTQGPPEQGFYGAGMQNGFNFRGQSIQVKKQEATNVPFFMAGGVAKDTPVMKYGVFTNTWNPGKYSFASPVTLAHQMEAANGTGVPSGTYYVDRFYMLGDFATVLDEYTSITGRPFMIPVYGLGLGDSNCYHNSRHDNDSRTALSIAETYNKKALPLGWQIFDDGYGCGIGNGNEGPGPTPASNPGPLNLTMVNEISQNLLDMGIVAGLWSSTGLHNFSTEVKGGIRVGKTDVGWVGRGGKYAYEAVQQVADGIEGNSDSRRFIYTCVAWAGAHHNAVMWTGDNSGSYDYEQMQMQYFVNSYMSGMAHVSGDVDGIFGGSPETYVRDIQMKSMQTAFMTMSGWAGNPQRQPWADGLVTEGLVRTYLDLKVQLTPYQYTLSRGAYETGYPPARTMALEFPTDAYVFANNTATISQFMSGPSLLVAPVLTADVQRSVYFPSPATFYSFWDESSKYSGGNTEMIAAPLHVLPLFVKEGSIIPMYPQGILHAKDVDKATTSLTVHIWLSEEGTASFELYEDDGVTRDHEQGKFLKTLISASMDSAGNVTVTLGAAKGAGYTGAPSSRPYVIVLHRFNGISGASKTYTAQMTGRVTIGGNALPLYSCPDSMQWLSKGGAGFAAQSKLLTVQTGKLSTSSDTVLAIKTKF